MFNSTNLKKKNKNSGKKTLFRSAVRLYVALTLAVLVGTFGWFTINTLVFVQNQTPGNIQISVSSGDLWIANNLDDFSDSNYAKKAQMLEINHETATSYIDISGNGSTLYYPKSLEINANNEDIANLSSADNFVDVTGKEGFYIELRVYFRTTSEMDVYLSKDSAIEGLQKKLTNTDNVNAFFRTSLFGNFNCDGIIGAARVAFLESNMDEENEVLTLKNVWIPNDDIRLSYSDSERVTATLEEKVATSLRESRTTGYHYLEKKGNTMEEKTYSAEDYAQGKVTVTSTTDTETILANPITKMSNQAVPLLSFDQQGTVQTKLLVIRIWFEGTDREADKALNGGMATYNLNFLGISKNDSVAPLASENDLNQSMIPEGHLGIYYNTTIGDLCYYEAQSYNLNTARHVDENFLVYSLDGIEWHAFTSTTSQTVFNPKRGANAYSIYIRVAETNDKKPSNVVSITIPANS